VRANGVDLGDDGYGGAGLCRRQRRSLTSESGADYDYVVGRHIQQYK
jgi:hypothetical protein